MNSGLSLLLYLASALCSLGVTLLLLAFATVAPEPVPTGGRRALCRQQALARWLGFRLLEPVTLRAGALVHAGHTRLLALVPSLDAPLARLRQRQAALLVHAGEPGGFDVWGAWGLAALLGGMGLGLGALLGERAGVGGLTLPCGLLGAGLFSVRLSAMAHDRLARAAREMPVAIELTALSMSAGLDFPGALSEVTSRQRGVAAEELGHVLIALDLGITRAAALTTLGERVPIAEVRDLVRAVVLAEKKGASVSEALVRVAASSRQRRTIRAEEAASRAGALMMIPLMLLLGCVLILLLAPLLIGGVGLA